MTEETLYFIAIGLGALLIGSFLNVVIYRLPRMLKTEWRTECELLFNPSAHKKTKPPVFNLCLPRSSCPQCTHIIPWWHNIPLLSFIMLKGRCATCNKHISWQYPCVEFLSLLLSLVATLYFGFTPHLVFALLFIWTLMCLTAIDLQHQLLPDGLTLGLLWLGLLANTLHLFAPLQSAILGAVCGYLSLWLVMKGFFLLTGKIGMGHGDFKLLAALGAWFGWSMLPTILLIASILGAIAGMTYLKLTKQSKETPIPFGPFLCLAGFFVLFFNQYLGLH